MAIARRLTINYIDCRMHLVEKEYIISMRPPNGMYATDVHVNKLYPYMSCHM